MEEYERTDEIWRKVISKVFLWLAAAELLLELGLAIIRTRPLGEVGLRSRYLLYYMAYPAFFNLVSAGIGFPLLKKKRLPERLKNFIPVFLMLLECFLVSSLHGAANMSAVIFVFPVFLSALYADRRLTGAAAAGAVLLTVCAAWLQSAWKGTLSCGIRDAFPGAVLLAAALGCSLLMVSCMEQNRSVRRLLEQKIKRDQMTGLYNHSEFYKELKKAVREEPPGAETVIAIVDIDNFKLINDHYGHERGNAVLTGMARLLSELCPKEHISRYGGEEFTVIFQEGDVKEAAETMERFRNELERRSFDGEIQITASIGIARHEEGMSAEEVFEHADEAMYQAKRQGRNKLIIYSQSLGGINSE